ncbi:MAG: hypothetical protein PVJ92_01505, partial [Candidatus Dependentiae bacterium]
MKIYKAFLFFCTISLLQAAPGDLMLALHDIYDSSEKPSAPNVGGATMSAASALSQRGCTVIMSARIWHNIVQRRLRFAQNAQHKGSSEHALVQAYTTHLARPSASTVEAVRAAGANEKKHQQNLFLWQLPLTDAIWRAFFHRASGLYALIPTDEVGRCGLHTNRMIPVRLPPLSDDAAQQVLVRDAYNKSDQTRFSVTKFAEIFDNKHTRWAVYQNGHGLVPSSQEDSDALLHDRWFSWPSLPRHNIRDEAAQKKLAAGRYIAGLPLGTFRELLLFFNSLPTTAYYYQSCYGTGVNNALIHQYNSTDRLAFGPSLGLQYPLVAGALTDVTTLRTSPSLYAPTPWYYPHNYASFFAKAQQRLTTVAQLHALVTPITITTGSSNDPHGISTTPMALLPGAREFVPLDIARGSSDDLERPSSGKPGLLVVTKKSGSQTTPLHITNTRAVMVIPREVTTPLVISPYRHSNP